MKYSIRPDLIFQKLGDNTVIFDSEKSLLYKFNSTASAIFKKIKQGSSEDEIVKYLINKYNVKEKEALADFKTLIEDLKKKKIISFLKSKEKNKSPKD